LDHRLGVCNGRSRLPDPEEKASPAVEYVRVGVALQVRLQVRRNNAEIACPKVCCSFEPMPTFPHARPLNLYVTGRDPTDRRDSEIGIRRVQLPPEEMNTARPNDNSTFPVIFLGGIRNPLVVNSRRSFLLA
jgi:hypothetical protein